ncbi:MAG: hypothetical protein JST30_16240 [Armatimonadetes bacterium]|nr:hypothetical protein [Armatimonadota bacterium]
MAPEDKDQPSWDAVLKAYQDVVSVWKEPTEDEVGPGGLFEGENEQAGPPDLAEDADSAETQGS